MGLLRACSCTRHLMQTQVHKISNDEGKSTLTHSQRTHKHTVGGQNTWVDHRCQIQTSSHQCGQVWSVGQWRTSSAEEWTQPPGNSWPRPSLLADELLLYFRAGREWLWETEGIPACLQVPLPGTRGIHRNDDHFWGRCRTLRLRFWLAGLLLLKWCGSNMGVSVCGI